MTVEETEALIAELERLFQPDVQDALDETSAEFINRVNGATELVAAAFSVSRIRAMWAQRVPALVRRLRTFARRSAEATAEDLGEQLPPTDVVDRELAPYVAATTRLLDAVGERLADAATQSLAEGVAEGETLAELKARMRVVFDDTGAQLGPVRAARIATTEVTRAWNAGVLAGAQALTGPERPLVKQWQTSRDERVRAAHKAADGQLQLLDDAFDVGGTPMQYPGDPTAPADLTINCRCILRTATAPAGRNNSVNGDDLSAAAQDLQSKMPPQLKAYWINGEGGQKIRWGTPGDFERCVRAVRGDFPQDPEGLCANLHHEATGKWPNESGADVHTGAMIALIPSEADAARLALPDGEPAEQLHVTLAYLGEAADWDPADLETVGNRLSQSSQYLSPLDAKLFGAAHWNPQSDSPAWVWSVGDGPDSPDNLGDAHYAAWSALDNASYPVPAPHTPWVAHMTAVYDVANRLTELSERVGPVTFDRLRLAVGGTNYDFPLGTAEMSEDEPMEDAPMTAMWSTPGGTALAFENQQTGDGRVFAPGALYWSGDGPWPLQFADEMQGGHDGAQLAGAIVGMSRVGDRIPGHGLLYLTTDAGVEAALLLAQGAPLGVSVDLDDVDMELVDASDEGKAAYRTKLLTASVMPAADGGWLLTGETAPTMTATSDSTLIASRKVAFIISANGTVPAGLLDLVAAAGDPDVAGTVVERQRSGEYLMRITRGRIRGATLVTIPAYADARIVLDNPEMFASYTETEVTAAIKSTTDYDKVLRHVRSSSAPVGAARVAQALKMPVVAAQRILAVAASRGEVVRLTRGLYTDKTTSAKADHLMNDNLVASDDADIEELAASVGDGGDEELINGMVASAWTALRDLPPMPAAWFREPTVEELPPGGPGVNYSNGRIFGWVAQAGEPHAGYARKVTIDTLGRIDTTHFLRQRFTLDNGESVKAGAFTMNAGHHRDGAECETSSCQFDDTRTVAGIVTVGMNERGMWFSGAAAPWLSEWDRSVFMSTQPSYHLRKGNSGSWQLRAVLAVPVPGHSSPLMASAVVGRAQMALTAAASMADVEEAVAAETERQAAEQSAPVDIVAAIDYDRLADALVAAGKRAERRQAEEAAELSALMDEASKLDLDSTGTEGA